MASWSGRFLARAIALSLTAAVLLVHPVLLATGQEEGRGWVGTWAARPALFRLPLMVVTRRPSAANNAVLQRGIAMRSSPDRADRMQEKRDIVAFMKVVD